MPENASGSRHVLLIGIDRYPASITSLNGCVNDVDAFEAFLIARLGVPRTSIQKLISAHPRARKLRHTDGVPLDAENLPTRTAIVEALTSLATRDDVKKDDRVLIYYSGHGTQPPQARVSLEGLVPFDSPTARDILDRDLSPLLESIAARGVDLTVVLDCCHSAGATRDLGQPAGAVRASTTTAPVHAPISAARGTSDRLFAGIDRAAPPFVVIAACQSGQKALELPPASPDARGAFSHALLQALESYANEHPSRLEELRWADIWEEVREAVTLRASQTPWLIGRYERRVFGGPWEPGDAGFPVRAVADEYRLGAGTMAGLAPGAVVAIYGREPPFFPALNTQPDVAARTAFLAVTSATLGNATAVWVEGDRKLPEGARARLVTPAPGDELVVQLEPYDEGLAAWLTTQKGHSPVAGGHKGEYPLFKVVPPGSGAVEAFVGKTAAGSFWIGDEVHGPTRGGEPPLAEVPEYDRAGLAVALSHMARYNLALRLAKRSRDLHGALVVKLLDGNDKARAQEKAREDPHDPDLPEVAGDPDKRFTYRAPDGQVACVTVTNTSSVNLYVTVFDCASSGRVFGLGSSNVEIKPGRTETFWWRGVLGRFIAFNTNGRSMVERIIAVGATNAAARLDGLEIAQSFAEVLAPARGRGRDPSGDGEAEPPDPRELWTASMITLKLAGA